MITPTTLPPSSFRRPKRAPFGVGAALVLLVALGAPSAGCILDASGVPGGAAPCSVEDAILDLDPVDCEQFVCTDGKFILGPAIPSDGNPCTTDACSGKTPRHDPQTGTPCQVGMSSGQCEAGNCAIACTADGQCDDKNPCTRDTCNQNKCEFTPDDSLVPADTNPCTAESCTDGKLSSVPLKDAPCGAMGKCNGAGDCVGCTADTDCNGDDVCNERGCDTTTGMCFSMPKPDGTTPDPMPGDCKMQVCAAGEIQTLTDDNDKPNDNNECTLDACIMGSPSISNQGAGTACGNNNACNGSGACVDCANGVGCGGNETCVGNACETCGDGKQNNGETDVDCGGPKCGKTCGQGKTCASGGDCQSNFCVDGVCCNSACNSGCEACSAAKSTGNDGVCSPVDAGKDPDNECGGGDNCNGNGKCSCQDGMKNGAETATDCGGGTCGKCSNGQPCGNGGDCTSNFCVDGYCCNNGCAGTCASCSLSGKEGMCTLVPAGDEDPGLNSCTGNMACDGGGSCLKENGQPCTDSSECLSGTCGGMPKVCK